MSLGDLRPYLDGRVSTLPLLVLHATEACDSRCVGCSYGEGPGSALDLGTAAALARDADRLDTRVVLVTGGEPLTVPHLDALVRPFVRPGRRLFLATSGTRLPEQSGMVAAIFDEVFASLDGPDAASHDAVRGVPTFHSLAKGVAALKAERPIPVTARVTVSRLSIDHIAAIIRTSRSLQMDRVSFLPVDTWSPAFGRNGGARPTDLLPSPAQVDGLAAAIPAIEEELGSELVPNLEHVVRYLRASLGLEPWPPKMCNTPLVSAVVEAGGAVRPCFFKAPTGDHRTAGLAAALHSPEAVALRRSLDTASDPDCQRCVCPKYYPIRSLLLGRLL